MVLWLPLAELGLPVGTRTVPEKLVGIEVTLVAPDGTDRVWLLPLGTLLIDDDPVWVLPTVELSEPVRLPVPVYCEEIDDVLVAVNDVEL